MDYLAEKFGAWQSSGGQNKGKVRFKLFFPNISNPQIQSIQVAGDFQDQLGQAKWDFTAGPQLTHNIHAEGDIWSFETNKDLTANFYQYKYFVTFNSGEKRIITDPFTRYGGSENENAAFVIGGSQPSSNIVNPLNSGRKHLRDLVIYELMIDDFTDEYRAELAPIEAVTKKLDYLQKELGINAILFLPWTAWQNNTFNWGYNPYLYFSVEHRYVNNLATPVEKLSLLKNLINECHKRDIHVIMDGVFNHVSLSFPYKEFYQNRADCPYTGIFYGSFSGLQDLNFNNTCTQEFIRDVCLYWIKNFKIDGIRFDNTVNFYNTGDMRGLPKLLEDIQNYLNANNEINFSLTLEHLQMDAVEVTKNTKANSYWDNSMYQKCFDYLWHWQINSGILNSFNNNRFLKGTGKVPTTYLSNHDHSYIAWQAGARFNEGSNCWYKTQPHTIALLTSPGAAMIQNGQEFAEDHWIVENDHESSRRVQPRPIRWDFKNDKYGKVLLSHYRKLIDIQKKYPALRSDNFYPEPWDEWQTQFNTQGYGVDVGRQLVIYHRWGNDENGNLQRFIIVINFSETNHYVDVPFSGNGAWIDLLNNETYTIYNYKMNIKVTSNWGRVFVENV